jgi:iron complex outermembrane receptor protein
MRLNADVIPPSAATGGLPLQAVVFGNKNFQSEGLIAYEAGYRVQATSKFSVDFAGFYNSYSDLLSAEPGAPILEMSPVVHLTLPLVAGNKRSGRTYGTELFAEWRPMPKFRLTGSYSFLNIDVHGNPDSLDASSPNPGGASPRHQYYVRSSFDLTKKFEQDMTLRYVAKLDGLAIPSYYSLDARLGWKATPKLEFSINGLNLLNDRHLEFRPDFINTTPTQIKRTFNASVTWKFN